jgi:hypothetical protein
VRAPVIRTTGEVMIVSLIDVRFELQKARTCETRF